MKSTAETENIPQAEVSSKDASPQNTEKGVSPPDSTPESLTPDKDEVPIDELDALLLKKYEADNILKEMNTKKPEIDYDIFDEEKEKPNEDEMDFFPSLSGDPDEIIDLETGDVTHRPATGPELLYNKLLCSRGLKNKAANTTKSVS
jgi:hypothetical protein